MGQAQRPAELTSRWKIVTSLSLRNTCNALRRLWREDEGVLTFEWTLLLTLLVIGIVSGLTGARDAIIDELGDIAAAAVSLDQTYTVDAFSECGVTAPAFSYDDTPGSVTRCGRSNLSGQGVVDNGSFPTTQ